MFHRPAEWRGPKTVEVLALVAALPVLSGTMLVVAVPDLAMALGTTTGKAVSVVTVYLIVLAVFQPFAGGVADHFGILRMARMGLVTAAAGSLLAMTSWSFSQLLVARGLQAVGFALVLPCVHALMVTGRGGEGRRLGLVTAVGLVAAAAGPLLGGWVTVHGGWRGVFLITGVLAAAGAAVVPGDGGHRESCRLVSRARAAADLSRDRRLRAALWLHGLDNFVLCSLLVGIPLFVVGQGALQGGACLAVMTLAGAAAAPVGGRLADHRGPYAAIRLGFALAAAGLVLLALSSLWTAPWATFAFGALAGFGLGIEFPGLVAAPLIRMGRENRATATGLMATARHAGSAAGALMTGLLVSRGGLAIFGLAAIAAILASLLAERLQPVSLIANPQPRRGAIRLGRPNAPTWATRSRWSANVSTPRHPYRTLVRVKPPS